MNKAESKYYNTAVRMDEALFTLLEKKDFEYITVKEICEKAGVNRSTFYLHYETVGDLLDECVEYTNRKCFEKFGGKQENVSENIRNGNLNDLIFITPEYLKPYLEFVKENKRLFKVALLRPSTLRAEKTFADLFRDVFSPVLDCFHYSNESKPYVISFYVSGLIAIVSEWMGTLVFYYIVLSSVRFFILRRKKQTDIHEQWKSYHTCGIIMLLLTIALAGLHILNINQYHTIEYPGYVIYAVAAYTFYIVVIAIRNIIIYRKTNNPLLSASKALNLAVALISVYNLQSSMIAAFGGDDETFRVTMSNCVGVGVVVIIVSTSVHMIAKTNKKL